MSSEYLFNEALKIKIKRFSNSRSIKIIVKNNGEVLVSAPRHLPQVKVINFIEKNRQWIEESQKKSLDKQRRLTESYQSLLLRGKKYQFRLDINSKEKVVLDGDKLIVFSPKEDHSLVRDILTKWYRSYAASYFNNRVPLLADLLDLDVEKVTIRSQSTRWGSCSSRRTISLNWRLIMAPDWVSDYVIFHELAHLIHMNHSARFWATVEKVSPNYKKAQEWLKDNHKLLHF